MILIQSLYEAFFGEKKIEEGKSWKNTAPASETKDSESPVVVSEFDADETALKKHFGTDFYSGLCIEVKLSEILKILPRQRRRVDAYNKLVKHMKESHGVDLVITSQKTKTK